MSGGGSGPSFSLHSRCEIARLGQGEVVFVGQTSFAPGVWVGIALDAPNGKNNGTVQGKRYFDADDGHGVFVRPSQVHAVETALTPASSVVSTPPAATATGTHRAAAAAASSSRPPSGVTTPASRVTSPIKPGHSSRLSVSSSAGGGAGAGASHVAATPRARIAGSLGPGVGRTGTGTGTTTASGQATPAASTPATRLQQQRALAAARGVATSTTTPRTAGSMGPPTTTPRTGLRAGIGTTAPSSTSSRPSLGAAAAARTPATSSTSRTPARTGMAPSARIAASTSGARTTGTTTPAYGGAAASAARRQSLLGSGASSSSAAAAAAARSTASTPGAAQQRTQSRVSRTSSNASSTVSSGLVTPASGARRSVVGGAGSGSAGRGPGSGAIGARTGALGASRAGPPVVGGDEDAERTPRRGTTSNTAPGPFSATRRDSQLSRGSQSQLHEHQLGDEDEEEDLEARLDATLADVGAELDDEDGADLLEDAGGGLLSSAPSASSRRVIAASPTLEEAVNAELDNGDHDADGDGDGDGAEAGGDDPSASPTAPYSHNRSTETGTLSTHQHKRQASLVSPSAPIPRPNHMSLASSTSTSHLPRTAAEVSELMHELEELRARVRVLEKKREEEREAMRVAERKAEEAEGKERAVERLHERLKEMQATLKDQGKLERELEQIKDDFERQIVDLNEQLEMAMLDKEVAEEKYEALMHDFEVLKEEKEEMQLDRDLAREELAMFEQGEVPEADRTSTEFIKLERQNMRLQEALLRVRDVSNEVEADLKYKITELDKELASLSDIQQQYEKATARVELLEGANEDLRAQLDAALGAEEMLETLTERNLNLAEKLDASKMEKEELEELNLVLEELEEQQDEELRALQDQLYSAETTIHQLSSRVEAMQAEIVEQDGYIHQYRELVQNLNGEVEALRTEVAEGAVGEGDGDGSRALAVAQSQAMLEKEFQITRSASKKQAKTIEIELGKLKESQAMHQLDIIRSYLPPVYFNGDADAVAALLFFRRMSLKADIIKTVLESGIDIQESTNTDKEVPEHLIDVCMLRHSLVHFGAISRQISSILNFATGDDFLRAGQEFRSFQHIEKRVDAFIDALRNQELKEADVRKELTLYVDDFERFAQKFTSTQNAELPSMEVGVASLFEHDLDTLAAALGFAKQRIAKLHTDEEVEWQLGSRTPEADIFDPLQQLIKSVRATKVPARKLTRRLQNLFISDEAVRIEAAGALPSLSANSTRLVNFAKSLADNFQAYMTEVKTSKMPCSMTTLIAYVDEATNEAFKKSDQIMWTSALNETAELLQTIHQVLASATEPENIIKVTGTKPWLTRVQQIQAEMTHNADAERHISSQSEEIVHLRRTIKQRDQYIQEYAVKVERLTIHLNRSKEQVDQMSDLRKQLDDARKQAKDYQEANDQLQADLDRAEQEKTSLVQQQQAQAQAKQQQQLASAAAAAKSVEGQGELGGHEGLGGVDLGVAGFGGPGMASAAFAAASGNAGAGAGASGLPLAYANLETSYLVDQLEALRAAMRHLRTENAYLRGAELMRGWSRVGALPRVPHLVDRAALADRTNLSMGVGKEDGKTAEDDKDDAGAGTTDGRALGEPVPRRLPGELLPKSERLRALATESRGLHAQALNLIRAPRIVDLSVLVRRSTAAKVGEGSGEGGGAGPGGGDGLDGGAGSQGEEGNKAAGKDTDDDDKPTSAQAEIKRTAWQPAARLPINQYRAQKELAARIRARVEALSEKVRAGVGGGKMYSLAPLPVGTGVLAAS